MSQTTKKLRIGIEKLRRSSKPLVENQIPKPKRLSNNQANIEYLESITTIGEMVVEARKNRDSEKLRQMAKAITQIAFYVNQLELDRNELLHKVIYKE